VRRTAETAVCASSSSHEKGTVTDAVACVRWLELELLAHSEWRGQVVLVLCWLGAQSGGLSSLSAVCDAEVLVRILVYRCSRCSPKIQRQILAWVIPPVLATARDARWGLNGGGGTGSRVRKVWRG